MTGRRISIHDYPEHLNPFNEHYNDGADTDTGHKTKYYTWSSAGRHKIKHAILDKPWSSMSPSKLGRKLSFIKAITIDKLSPSKSKHKAIKAEPSTTPRKYSTPEEPFVIVSPKQREKLRRLAESATNSGQENVATISNGNSSQRSPEDSATPVRTKLSCHENGTPFDDTQSSLPNSELNRKDDSQLVLKSSSENKEECSSTGARPKPRKKRVAPPPPPNHNNNNISADMESNASSMEEGERSISPDDSITQILEQDAIAHSDNEHDSKRQ